MSNYNITINNPNKKQGFTLVELMVTIAVVAIISAIALPSMNNFLVKMRVDNQISEMQRLLLTARNMAINTGKNTTVCPLYSGECSDNWQGEISVFTNGSNSTNNDAYETTTDDSTTDVLIKIKEAIKSGEKLQFAHKSVVYSPSGRLLTGAGFISYCPEDNADESRGIDIQISGRSYTSSDTDNDGKDEDRNNNEITCSSS